MNRERSAGSGTSRGGRKPRKRSVVLALVVALLTAGCTLVALTPPPGVPGTAQTEPAPGSPTVDPAPPTLTPFPHAALAFDGQDDYVIVPDAPSLDLQSSFTIAAWIYLDEYTGWASVVTKGDTPNINNYAFQQSEPFDPVYKTEYGNMRFSGCVGLPAPLPESETVLSLRTWHFVAVTYDGSRIMFYLNGKPDGVGNVPGPLCVNDRPLYIGVDFPLTTEYWHGAIDELRIWNLTLAESQIVEVMQGSQVPFGSALVGYWSFDEGSGAVAHDASGYGNNGLLMGSPAWIPRNTPVP